jgi:hypothetical protein
MGFERIEQGTQIEATTLSYEERPEIIEMKKTLVDLEELQRNGRDVTPEEHAMIRGNILQMKLALRHKENYSDFTEKHGNDFRKAIYTTYPPLPEDNFHDYNHEKFLQDIEENESEALDKLDNIVYH